MRAGVVSGALAEVGPRDCTAVAAREPLEMPPEVE